MAECLPRCLFLVLPVLLAAAAASAEQSPPFTAGGQVWPPAPEPARIQWVAAFSTAADLGIRRGAWESLKALFTGAANESLGRPMAVAATTAGEVVVVADPGAQCVHRFDLRRGRYECLARARGESLPSPVGVAIDNDGRVYATDSILDLVLVAGPGDRHLKPLALSPPPSQPTGIAVSGNGTRLFVASTGDHTVRQYDATGRLVRELGGRGARPGEMNYPTYLWLAPDGQLLVTDSLNFRVERFAADGRLLGAFGRAGDTSGSLARPKGVAMDHHGHVYVVDGLLNALQVFDLDGQLLLALGQQGRDAGEFWLPAGIFVTPDDLIFVADSYNGRVQVFRYLGGAP